MLGSQRKEIAMPNVMSVLKQEISRLARKEAKAMVAPVRKPSGATRKALADLKRRIGELEKETRRLGNLLAQVPVPQEEKAAGAGTWISGKGVRSLRHRLGLSQVEMAKLVGVTPNAVCMWERKPGMLRLRAKTKASVMAIRHWGAREAKAKLAEMTPAKRPAAKRRARK